MSFSIGDLDESNLSRVFEDSLVMEDRKIEREPSTLPKSNEKLNASSALDMSVHTFDMINSSQFHMSYSRTDDGE